MLVGAGALSGSGHMNLALAVGAAMVATLGADVLWYALGRAMGTRVLGTLCRFSLDPDSFIRDAKQRFLAHRARYLVVAKFLPGVNPLAAGLAGAVSIRPTRFLLYASVGALLWAGIWITLGYACADVIGLLATRAAGFGKPLAIALALALAAYLATKYARRQSFLRHLRKARITPPDLKRRLDAGDHLVIVDLRTALDIETIPYGIPGAFWIAPEELQHPHPVIPAGSEVVFYCAEPREATSALMALRLAANGFHNVHPLSGGLEGWRQAGFPVEPFKGVSST
jgi:membrane protein DedA with SNARE-associated domain/rhodanese-related sulfurtransferase